MVAASTVLVGTAAAQNAEPEGLAEVIVTAQRRTESAQKASVAIDTVSATDLQRTGVTDPVQLTKLVPSIQFAKSSGATVLFYLRGIGSNATTALTDPAIATSLDGAFMARSFGISGQFYDIERVEVLKGPQGTLYGRNATGGAVNVITRAPTFYFAAEGGVVVGNYDHFETNGSVSGPITENLALRAAFQTIKHDGYLSDGEADDDSRSVRLQALYKPSDDFSFRLIADGTWRDGMGGGNVINNMDGITVDDRIGLTDPRAQLVFSRRGFRPILPEWLKIDSQQAGVQGELNWKSPAGQVTVIPAYRRSNVQAVGASGSLGTYSDKDIQSSIEARLANSLGPVDAILGGYLSKATNETFLVIDNRRGGASGNDYDTVARSAALFGNATYNVREDLRLVAGLRYTSEKKSITGIGGSLAPGAKRPFLDRSRKDDAINYRVGVEWEPRPASLLYATVSTGFHSGGFFFTVDDPSFDPEKVTAYTIGSKNRFFNNSLQVNVELFDWEYKDQQLIRLAPDSAGNNVPQTINAGQTRIRGVEGSIDYLLTPDTKVGLQVQYLDAKFLKFTYTQAGAVSALSLCTGSAAGGGQFRINCEGLRPEKAPAWSINPSFSHTFRLAEERELTLALSGHYQTKSYTAITFLPTDLQKAYWMGDASLSFKFSDKLSVTGFVNNFTDETVINNTQHSQVDSSNIRTPRTYGLRLDVRY
jgi:iron complex outermembrane receptor protein